jgi:catechol 2,3-dioxygenase-like lactoylglutathione lyase family enzyme
MGFSKSLRPGLVQLRVLDLDKTLDFYTNILGNITVTTNLNRPVQMRTAV